MKSIAINTRILHSPLTGLQRYTIELLRRLHPKLDQIQPYRPLSRTEGVLWEQLVLPTRVRGRLLWNPHSSGPITTQRQVVTIHDVSPLDHPEWFEPLFARWQRFLIPRLAKQAQRIITISNFSKSRLLEFCEIPEEKIAVIPNGVNPNFAPQKAEDIVAVQQHLKLPSPHYLLCVGTIEPRKNISRLLSAWKLIHQRIDSDIWLVIAGLPGKIEVFKRECIDDIPPRVHMAGHIHDDFLPTLYAGALASIYLSVYEGFGLPPLESMATGTPVVASNLTSLPEVLGDAALTVDPYNEVAIATALETIIENNDLRRSLAAKALVQAARFSWDRTAHLTWQCLQDSLFG